MLHNQKSGTWPGFDTHYVFRSMLNFCSFSKKCFSGLRAIISALEQFLLFWCFSSFSITNHHFSPSIPSHSLGSLGESPLTALAAKIRHLKEACPFFFSCTDLHRMSPSSATGIQPRQVQHGEGHHLRCVWRTKGGGQDVGTPYGISFMDFMWIVM